ncbi:ATP-binding protein [Natrialba swarupiae]|uniref:histidine kinase n=1 Tax=Natrialba swarupiae TaxID=2448032 RepID=A0A5D5AJT6_9EURY|nr:ATP-binding protein [Natrialba swarupiae]TYT61946.1 PAS domain-containing protein [Natrialba swarupiae]
MSRLLDEPTVVVVVGESVREPALRETLLDGAATEVLLEETGASALETIDEREDIGCVVTDRSLSDTTGIDLCRRVEQLEADLPVVFYVDEHEEGHEVARQALNAGVSGYYTRSDSAETVRRAVDDVIDTYSRRREAAEESEIFTTLLEEIETNVYVKDREGRYVRVASVPDNVDPADAIGKTDVEIYGDANPEMARKTYEDDVRVVETGEPIYDRDEQYGDGKTAYAMRTTKVPWVGDDGTTKGLVGMTVDITEFKRTELELEILRDQFEKFSTNVRHDLKNPLQVAMGHLQLARTSGADESFDAVQESLERIEEIVTDLESIAKDLSSAPERGANELVEIADSVWNVLYTRDATLENELPPAATVYTAKETIRPVFENLFKNAIDHGESDVTVRVGPLEDGFYVEDTGPGIPESERESVLQAGYTTESDGSGMGLSIVSDVCVQRGWSLEIGESSEGGARFEITNSPMVLEPIADDRSDVHADRALELTDEIEVGTLQTEGKAEYDPITDRWSVSADGTNIWRHWNDFYFVHTPVDGPVSIRGRVTDIEEVDAFSKAGFMIRDELEDASTYGFVGATPGFGTEVLWRTQRGEDGTSQQLREESRSEWFRVDLLDGYVTCFVSQDGQEWTAIDQRRIEQTTPIHVGLVVCSVVSGQPCEATFEDVTVVELERTVE